MGELMLDGNAIAGLLQELFAVEMLLLHPRSCAAACPFGLTVETHRPESTPLGA
jgi:hypothetical protein